jgi:protein SCO1/2
MSLKALRWILWGAVAGVSMALVIFATVSFDLREGTRTASLPVPLGGEFQLQDENGLERTWSSFRGKPAAVFFGFTNCPDICPTTLAELTLLLKGLGPKGDDLSVILVTGDPARDRPHVLKAYLEPFDHRIVALTGPESEIDAAFKSFKAYRKIVPVSNGDYTVDHSAGVYLYDRKGEFAGTLDMHESPEARVEKVGRLVAG